jgi:hypothetical protein
MPIVTKRYSTFVSTETAMTLFDRLTQLFSKNAQKHVYAPIPRDHVADADYSDEPLVAGKHYFRLWLKEMFLEKEVDWFRTWIPMAHSLVVFQFGNQKLEIPHVAGPTHIKDLDEGHLQNVISLNHPMTSLMPFDGGVVEVVIALVGMKGKDFAAAVTKVLGDLSKLLMQPQLSSALSIALPVATGVQDLLGGESGQIHLGVHQSFTGKAGGGASLRGGYIAVIRGSEAEYPPKRLWVANGGLRIGDSLAGSQPLTGVTHMLLQLEGQTERDDYRSLTSISDAFEDCLKQLSEGAEDKAKDAFRQTLFLVKTSPDLTRAHRVTVAAALREEFEQARQDGLASVRSSERSLSEIIRRRAPNAQDVQLRDESLESLFDLSN